MEGNIQQKLSKLRNELKLAKDQFNPEGGYAYRNAEAMGAMIKPEMDKVGLTYWFDDRVEQIGQHCYVHAVLTVMDPQTGEDFSVNGYAREDDRSNCAYPKITGAASTYAHKYALQNLLAVDDGKSDPDAPKATAPTQPQAQPIPAQPQAPAYGAPQGGQYVAPQAPRQATQQQGQAQPVPTAPMPAPNPGFGKQWVTPEGAYQPIYNG